MHHCTCLCPACGGPATYGGGFPCYTCLTGGFYTTPQGYLRLTPGPNTQGPFYPQGYGTPGASCPLCGGACLAPQGPGLG